MENEQTQQTEESKEHIFFRKLIHDIRNFIALTDDKIEFIRKLTHEQKLEIIMEYDKIVQFVNETL
jgi:hypothetical protein